MADRRSFLRGLASLPLIGGSVALIGSPTQAAVPVTDKLLDAYNDWLDLERSWLLMERYGNVRSVQASERGFEAVWRDRETGRCFTYNSATSFAGFDHRHPASRAAVILSAVGVPLPKGSRL